MIPYAGLSDCGKVRHNNEDRWFADAEQGLFIVSDGVGGKLAGELASRIVVEILPERLRRVLADINDLSSPQAAEGLVEVISSLSRDVRNESQNQPGLDGMGATLVMAAIRGALALVAHLGDSRAYLLRDGSLEQLTKDHTVAQYLIDAQALPPGTAPHDALVHALSRYVGMEEAVEPDIRAVKLQSQDRLLLCTDGLSGMLDEGRLCAILLAAPDPRTACQLLIDAANDAGGKDNTTAVVLQS